MRSPDDRPAGIGATLIEARTRLGIDLRAVEEETKIRIRYLKALEAEDWDTLPGDAYIKGFLRTYATILGVDGDRLADEYRRHHETRAGSPYPLADQVLHERRRIAEGPGRGRGLIAGGLALALVALLLILGLTSGDDDQGEPGSGAADRREKPNDKRDQRKGEEDEPAPREVFELTLVFEEDAQACLVALDGEEETTLLAGQRLAAGTEESFEGKRFVLDLGPGRVRFLVDGEEVLEADQSDPVAYRITSRGPEVEERKPDPGCG